MIDITFYAPGLSDGDHVIQLGHELELLPGVHYHVDASHDIVYFDMETPVATVAQLERLFTGLGLTPRLVGQVPDSLAPESGRGDGTVRTG